MTSTEFQQAFHFVSGWIGQTLAAHAATARTTASFNFPRLRAYFGRTLLERAKVVLVDRVPMPPLSSIRLSRFADFENMDASGITYLDTYFIRRHEAGRESLHFHELVHVIQWQVLGAEKFLALYADGLEKHGYRNSPLEVMAYDHEARFNASPVPHAVEREVRIQLARLPAPFG
jgi:hypothetical protein